MGNVDVILIGLERDNHSSTDALKGGRVGYWKCDVLEAVRGPLEGGSEESAISPKSKCHGTQIKAGQMEESGAESFRSSTFDFAQR
jgi:hypothetical protein